MSKNKKIVSFVQPNFKQGPREYNAYFLPYSSGVIWSYAKTSPEVDENYELGEFIFKRESLDLALEKLQTSDVIAFSTYIWNHQYNFTLAKNIKKKYPNKFIIFGGPEPAIENPDFFKEYPYIDLVVKLEGEITFRRILEELGRNLSSIPGLLINDNGATIDTGSATRITNLEDIPSPYLTGVFDKIISNNPDVEWNSTLETNRGCPYQCTFCDWGSLTYNKVKKFNLERVFEELEFFGKLKTGFISFTDANFGAFLERDDLIADKLIEVREKYGYPKGMTIAWAKNQKQGVVDIVKKLMPYFNHGLTLSVQSLDENVLTNIRRKNMAINKLEEIFQLCEQNSVPMYTELILGLPGETIDTWKENFWRLFRSGNHTGITVYQAQLLENAEMNLMQRKLYKMKSQKVYDYFSGSYSNETIEESIEVVTSTKDLPPELMLDAEIFAWFVNTFHINGLSTLYSRFVKKYLNVDYAEFYTDFYEFIKTDPWFANEELDLRKNFKEWFATGKLDHEPLGGIEVHGSNLLHKTILNIQIDRLHDHVYNLINAFMKRYEVDQELIDAINELQRNYAIEYELVPTYPKILHSKYNIYQYITGNDELKKAQSEYFMDFPEDKDISFGRFLEYYYFARRRDFGKAKIRIIK